MSDIKQNYDAGYDAGYDADYKISDLISIMKQMQNEIGELKQLITYSNIKLEILEQISGKCPEPRVSKKAVKPRKKVETVEEKTDISSVELKTDKCTIGIKIKDNKDIITDDQDSNNVVDSDGNITHGDKALVQLLNTLTPMTGKSYTSCESENSHIEHKKSRQSNSVEKKETINKLQFFKKMYIENNQYFDKYITPTIKEKINDENDWSDLNDNKLQSAKCNAYYKYMTSKYDTELINMKNEYLNR